jgi:hypothetical protein
MNSLGTFEMTLEAPRPQAAISTLPPVQCRRRLKADIDTVPSLISTLLQNVLRVIRYEQESQEWKSSPKQSIAKSLCPTAPVIESDPSTESAFGKKA